MLQESKFTAVECHGPSQDIHSNCSLEVWLWGGWTSREYSQCSFSHPHTATLTRNHLPLKAPSHLTLPKPETSTDWRESWGAKALMTNLPSGWTGWSHFLSQIKWEQEKCLCPVPLLAAQLRTLRHHSPSPGHEHKGRHNLLHNDTCLSKLAPGTVGLSFHISLLHREGNKHLINKLSLGLGFCIYKFLMSAPLSL